VPLMSAQFGIGSRLQAVFEALRHLVTSHMSRILSWFHSSPLDPLLRNEGSLSSGAFGEAPASSGYSSDS
jgi:hypothetical protein